MCWVQIQSQHWRNDQATLFISILSFLDADVWDAHTDPTATPLEIGTEVTVYGESTGQKVNVDAFWGRVVGVEEAAGVTGAEATMEEDTPITYTIQDASGNEHSIHRSDMRVRKRHTHCFVWVTGDSSHDSYAMQFFSEKELEWLAEPRGEDDMAMSLIDRHKLRGVFQHSDNAGTVGRSVAGVCMRVCVSTRVVGVYVEMCVTCDI